jgi:hypothetical protein
MRETSPTREQLVVAEPGSAVYALLEGDIHIRSGRPIYRIDAGPPPHRTAVDGLARRQPSRLLHPAMRVVDFHGRRPELDRLGAWRDAPDRGITVQLLHGPGGQGKTRLADEFADRSARRGWTCWRVRHLSDPTEDDRHQVPRPGARLLLIVDYAERWPLADLRLLLGNPLLGIPVHCRVLLVSRTADLWWRTARTGLDLAAHAVANPPLYLAPPAPDAARRHEIYQAAWTAFARALELDEPPGPPLHDLDEDAFALTLTLHMAALVAADARARGQQPPSDPAHLSAYLLDREHDYWSSLLASAAVQTPPQTMARAVHTVTLTGSVSPALARTALARAQVAEPVHAAAVVATDHAVVYPPTSPPATTLTPLYPDRLGEDFIALRTPGHDNDDFPADPWAAGLPTRLLPPSPSEALLPYTRNALTVLIETAARWDHIAYNELHPLLYGQPALALAAGGAALARLAEMPSTPVDLLESLEAHLPDRRHPDLDPGIAVLARRLTEVRLLATEDPLQRAILHHDLAARLVRAGDWDGAVAHGRASLDLLRPLRASVGSDPYVQLTRTLRNLASHTDRIGDPAAALALVREAVDRDRAHQEQQDGNAGELAVSMSNLAAQLFKVGR